MLLLLQDVPEKKNTRNNTQCQKLSQTFSSGPKLKFVPKDKLFDTPPRHDPWINPSDRSPLQYVELTELDLLPLQVLPFPTGSWSSPVRNSIHRHHVRGYEHPQEEGAAGTQVGGALSASRVSVSCPCTRFFPTNLPNSHRSLNLSRLRHPHGGTSTTTYYSPHARPALSAAMSMFSSSSSSSSNCLGCVLGTSIATPTS